MAKIKPFPAIDYYTDVYLELIHIYTADPFEPGAYHTIWPYQYPFLPPGQDAWAHSDSLEHGLVMAASWASLPLMMQDICLSCRFYDYGPALPRWNIYRGRNLIRSYPEVQDYPARIIPCFAQDWLDPPPFPLP